jgi:hypothetical protein
MSLANKRFISVIQYDLEGNFIKEWGTIIQASKFLNKGINVSANISTCCRGRTKNSFWIYLEI